MRGYPKGPLKKQDYENLLSMKEYADQVKADLVKIASIDDSKITVDRGTKEAPNIVVIDNPMPIWKRDGFKDKADITALAAADIKPIDVDPIKPVDVDPIKPIDDGKIEAGTGQPRAAMDSVDKLEWM